MRNSLFHLGTDYRLEKQQEEIKNNTRLGWTWMGLAGWKRNAHGQTWKTQRWCTIYL